MSALTNWQNFYVIVGSSAGALIGLQFVLISLIGQLPNHADTSQAGRAFSTPTVVHFTAVLLLAAAGCAPWQAASSLAVVWGIGGAAGLVYELNVVRVMARQRAYRPEGEDWIFHAVLPMVAYGVLAGAAFDEHRDLRQSLFAVAATILLLLVIGIHNAWDAATWHVFVRAPREKAGS